MALKLEVLESLITEAEDDREKLLETIDLFERGTIQFWEQCDGGPKTETTKAYLEKCKRDLIKIIERLARYAELMKAV